MAHQSSRAASFAADGYLRVDHLLLPDELPRMRAIYDALIAGAGEGISPDAVQKHRYDLGTVDTPGEAGRERILQVMWVSDIVPTLQSHPVRERCLAVAREVLGEDVAFDFDMAIAKFPSSNTTTPIHQDAAYWPDLPVKRAVSFWVALDDSTLENGCMWYGKPQEGDVLRPHHKAGSSPSSPLTTHGGEDELRPVPIPAGAGVGHSGRTLHYSRGNTTDKARRAYILNYRPAAMVELMRSTGFDHGRAGHKENAVRSTT